MTIGINTSKRTERDRLAREIMGFLAKGGKVQKIPIGESAMLRAKPEKEIQYDKKRGKK